MDALPDDVVERLVIEATEDTPLRPHEVRAIVERAEGNPLYVEEATKVARRSGSVDELPESLHAALAAQIGALDPVSRRMLHYASVLGRSFRRTVLDETLATDGLRLDPATLAQLSRFLESDGPDRLKFRNSMLRDAAYEELAFKTRTVIHRAAGLAVERLSIDLDVDAPTMSLHFSRAGDDERTWTYALLAGHVARRSSANADAAAQYELAVDAARRLKAPVHERVAALAQLAELRLLAGMLAGSIEAYRRACELCTDDAAAHADLLVAQARVHGRAGNYRTGLRVLTQARRLLAAIEPRAAQRLEARIDGVTAFIRIRQERPKDARAMALQATRGARQAGDDAALEEALVFVDHADVLMGVPVAGDYTQQALEIAIAHGWKARESVARCNLGNFAFWAGRWRAAVDLYTLSRAAAVEAGNLVGAAETDVNIGELLVLLGRADEAVPVLRSCARVLRASGVEWMASYADMQRARASLAGGDLSQAETEISRVVTTFSELGESMYVLEASLVWADVVRQLGDAERALSIVEGAEAAASKGDVQSLRARTCLAKASALAAAGRPADAEALIDLGLETAREQGLAYEEAQLLRLSADLRAASDAKASRDLRRQADDLMAGFVA